MASLQGLYNNGIDACFVPTIGGRVTRVGYINEKGGPSFVITLTRDSVTVESNARCARKINKKQMYMG